MGTAGLVGAFAFSQLKSEPTFSIVSKTEFNGENTFFPGFACCKNH